MDALAEFQAKYGVTFTREMFSVSEPINGSLTLKPGNGDTLPPLGCHVNVYGYHGEIWQMVVTCVDVSAGTFTCKKR
jgi:hypothetical protein